MAVLVLAACDSAEVPGPMTQGADSTAPATTAPVRQAPAALFYTKAGSLFVSAPAGAPGRRLTDGPADAQPAPAPDLSHVAFVRKQDATDYGGELWMLDLSPDLAPAAPPRRLVDPATLPPGAGQEPAMIARPRWSPTGDRLAFVANPTGGAIDGGILLVAHADSGALEPRERSAGAELAPFAETEFAWAPDGNHIVWLNARSDVRPVDVNVLAIGDGSRPVATGTNASSVAYAGDGRTILFTNADTTELIAEAVNPFSVRMGGVYAVPSSGNAPAAPDPLFANTGWSYRDIASLDNGAVAVTAQQITRGTPGPSAIQVLDPGSSVPRTTVTDVAQGPICRETPQGEGICQNIQGPLWGAGDFVAYLDASPEMSLLTTDLDSIRSTTVDTGVDTFAWAPRSR